MNRLQELRKSKGLTQEQLARIAEINLTTIQKMESGVTDIEKIRLGNALKLARALGITVADLAGEEQEEQR